MGCDRGPPATSSQLSRNHTFGGVSNLEQKTQGRLGNPLGGEAGVLAAALLPPPLPLSSPGSGGKLFIKTPPALSFICGE